jgi:hypothetical protein
LQLNFIGRYTQSLEEKIAALESRMPEAKDRSLGDTSFENDEASELAHSGQDKTHHANRTAPEVRGTQSLIIPVCTPPASLSSPLHSAASYASPIPGDQYGHSSLLIGLLATLTRGNPCGIAPQRSDTLREINLASLIAEITLKPSRAT